MADQRRRPPVEQIDVTPDHVRALLARVQPQLSDEEYRALEALIETLLYVADIVTRKTTSIARLRALLFGAGTEKTRDVLARAGVPPETPPDPPTDQTPGPAAGQPPPAGTRRGHGRHGAPAYAGAHRITMPHPSLTPGNPCPRCDTGTVYRQRDPKVLVRFIGQAPIGATVYALERLRCHLCGDVFTAPAPDGVGDASSAAMIALLKYGSGVPFHRLARLQAHVDLPLPASTQWEIVADVAPRIRPVLDELIRHAANGEVVHNDDTSMTVLSLLPKKRKDAPAVEPAPSTTSRRRARASSPRGSSRRATAIGSRCFSPAAGTRARTSRRSWRIAPPTSGRRFRCATPCRAIRRRPSR